MRRVKQKVKVIWRREESRPKTPSHPPGRVRPEEKNTSSPDSQAHSETEDFGPSPNDSPPVPIPDNPNSTRTDDDQPKAVQQLEPSLQATPDPKANTTSQARSEQPSHYLPPEDKLGSTLCTIGSLWKEAAESLEKEDREKLDRLIKSRRQDEAVDPSKDHGESSPPDGHGDSAPAIVTSVLSHAEKCKEKDEMGTWRPVIDNIIDGVKKFKSLGDAAVKFDMSGYAALGWSVLSAGLQIAANHKDARECALSSSEFVAEYISRYAQYEKWFRGPQPDEEFDRRLAKVYKAILLYVLALDDYLSLSGLDRAVRAVYSLHERTISKRKVVVVNADAKAKDWLPIVTFRSNKADFAELLKGFKAQNLPKPSQASQHCLRSLAFPEMDNRSRDIETAAKGTCEWLPRHKIYRGWVDCDGDLLWIKGKPGSGKSTLLRYALDNVMAASNVGAEAFILSFFFHGRGIELQKTPLGLFRSLLYQLLSRVPDELPDLVAVFQKHCNDFGTPDEKWQWDLRELQGLFESSLTNVLENRSVWLFVDALDESGEENAVELVRKLKLLVEKLLPTTRFPFRICFSCRHYPILDLDCNFEICLEHENKNAIATYVGDRLSGFSKRTSSTIPTFITSHANGVFLWAFLIVNRVLDLEREGEGLAVIEGEIRSTPRDLDRLYHELVRGMTPASLKLIQWICFATRPLSLDELRWAMVIDVDCPYKSLQECQDAKGFVRDADTMERKLKKLGCGLAEVVPSSDTRVVQFIHQSVRDFFINQGLSALDCSNKWLLHFTRKSARNIYQSVGDIFVEKDLPAPDGSPSIPTALIGLATFFVYLEYFTRGPQSLLPNHAFPLPAFLAIMSAFWLQYVSSTRDAKADFAVGAAHYRLSRICICYLAMEEIGQFATRDEYPTSDFPLLRYATTSWVSHVQQSEEKEIDQGDLLNYFDWPSEALVHRWERIHDWNMTYGWTIPEYEPKGSSMMHIASRNQLMGPLRVMADKAGTNIDAKDHNGRTPLSWAAESGHKAVVQLLLDRGAEVNVTAKSGTRTALSYAANNGHEAVVQLLLDRGAKVDVAEEFNVWTALSCAAEHGHKAVVQLLLDRRAEIGLKDGTIQTSLVLAASRGHMAITKLLLDQGAEVNTPGEGVGERALSCAAENGHEAVVLLLLDRGAEADMKSKYTDQTALSRAAENGHEAIVQVLLDQGAEVDAKDQYGQTPLLLAVNKGHEALAQLLLDRKAEVNGQDQYGHTALSLATRRGDKATVQLLLDRGAEVDLQDRYGHTALSTAAIYGYVAIAQLLLDRGAEVDVKDLHGQTPLYQAVLSARVHDLAIIQLLLDRGAKPDDASGYNDRTLLAYAVWNGRETLVQLLLDRGAEVDRKDWSGQTPLSLAARGWNVAIVQLLLDRGAEIDVKDEDGRTPLVWAVEGGREGIVQLLENHSRRNISVASAVQDSAHII